MYYTIIIMEKQMANHLLDSWLTCGAVLSLGGDRFLIGYGQNQRRKTANQQGGISFYFPDFFLESKESWVHYEQGGIISHKELQAFLCKEYKPSIPRFKWSLPSKSDFATTFQDLQSYFSEDKLHKAVPYLSQVSLSTMTNNRLATSILSALQSMEGKKMFLYGFWDFKDNGDGMLGVTPEVLFISSKADKVETMACAGTKPPEEHVEAFLRNQKEIEEHEWVVKDIVERLSPLGNVKKGDRGLQNYGKLSHLVTPIQLESCKPSFSALVEALHPTPALGAYPRKEGRVWLEDYAIKHPRGRFGAPVGGVFSDGSEHHSLCYVAIRNMQWTHNQISVSAGCGVIAKSQLDNEWREILLKLDAIKQMLSI